LNELNANNEFGEEYYLIDVWYNLNIHERQDFIVDRFKGLTGIIFSSIPYFDANNLS